MTQYYETFTGLPVTQSRINSLVADFSGLEKVEDVANHILYRLSLSNQAHARAAYVKNGTWSLQTFDGWFSELVRVELGKTLGIVRVNAVKKARLAGAGSAASAVLRRMYKSGREGNINIAGHHGRLSSRTRIVPEPTGGESGIRRVRTVKTRTKDIREYYGPDRDFILRIFSEGRDTFRATGEGPTGRGSKATYGRRGAMAPRWNFVHEMQSDMQQAAEQLGIELIGFVEKFIETKFKENG